MAKLKKISSLSSLIITQSNHLVEARYNLSLGEQRLILSMIAKIQPDDEDFKPYRISIGELADFLGIAKGSAYSECKKITKSLLGRVLEISEKGRLLQTGWVSSAEYIDGTGTVSLSFDPLLKPYLLKLQGNFTSCKFEMLLRFKSQYTMRLYMLLKQYASIREREIELTDLRSMLGLRDDQYKLYANLKADLLKPIQKELLKARADLCFDFHEVKRGRSVAAIRFMIMANELSQSLTIEQSAKLLLVTEQKVAIDALTLLLRIEQRTRKSIQVMLSTYEKKEGADYVKRNILFSNAKADKSYAGFLGAALKDDWGHDWELTQQEAGRPKAKALDIWERHGFPSMKAYDDFMFAQSMQAYSKAPEKPVAGIRN